MCCKTQFQRPPCFGTDDASSIPVLFSLVQDASNPGLADYFYWQERRVAQRLRSNETDLDALTTSTTHESLDTQRETPI